MNLKPKYRGGDNIITQFLTLQTSNITMTQNVLNIVHSISVNHRRIQIGFGEDTLNFRKSQEEENKIKII